MKKAFIIFVLLSLLSVGLSPRVLPEPVNTTPPIEPVRLVFIHHSTGGNWLADEDQNELGGGLARALMENNYYVSATNYGWGPDSIGDATDIPNWLDWFMGERSSVYLSALYAEDGQNFGDFGAWPRLADAPPGENRIIVLKSCFPNSDLEGRPDDPAEPEGWLTVSNAKYTYNEILKYFATRPDKLFVVVTAPPLINSSHAKNARAFNLWLVNDWLEENDYTLGNVAVFDFYNVLSGPDNHHRASNGQVEHTYNDGQNLSYFHSADDHPSREGNQKATQEFLPLLNAFNNHWIAGAGGALPEAQGGEPPQAEAGSGEEPGEPAGVESAVTDGYQEGFEGGMGAWVVYKDESGGTSLECQVTDERAVEGGQSLRLDFDVAADGWATCGVDFSDGADWSGANGLIFSMQSAGLDSPLHVDLYTLEEDGRASYYYTLSPSASDQWIQVSIPWAEFRRVDWEEDAGQPLTGTAQVSGIAFGMPSKGRGTFWVDDIRLLGSGEVVSAQENAFEEESDMEQPETEEDTSRSRFRLPFCGGAAALPLGALVMTVLSRRRSVNRNS